MKTTIINLLITATVAYVLQKVLGGVYFADFGTAMIFAIVLGVLNAVIKPILKLLSLPLTILTLGLFSLVINAIVVLLADYLVDGVHIDGFLWAVLFSILLSFTTSIVSVNNDD